jgi:hypothetical protein
MVCATPSSLHSIESPGSPGLSAFWGRGVVAPRSRRSDSIHVFRQADGVPWDWGTTVEWDKLCGASR